MDPQYAVEIPQSDFISLQELLETLTDDSVVVQNPLMGRAKRKISISSEIGNVELQLRSELYMDGEYKVSRTLVIAVISVFPERKGIGSKMLAWLRDYAHKKGFERICIENCHTEASQRFALRHRFSKVQKQILTALDLESYDYEAFL